MNTDIHALVGAALGSLLRDRKTAFLAGVASHLPADRLPHFHLSDPGEVVVAAATLAFVRLRYGRNSPEFAGAIGALVPDLEVVANRLGLLPEDKQVFPTHRGMHRQRNEDPRTELLLAIASLLILECDCPPHGPTAR